MTAVQEPTRRTAGLSVTADDRWVPSARARLAPALRNDDRFVAWAATTAITMLALFLRLWKLGRPHAFLFDETYYAKDAWSLWHHGYVTGYVDGANDKILAGHLDGLWTSSPSMVVHPEVGKWLIGLGEEIFGMDPFGWRVASAVAGALMVGVMIRLARRLTGSTLLGCVAGLLLCFDGLQLVLSRLALLDIFMAFFLLCAVACLVADRDWGRLRLARLVPSDLRTTASDWGPVRAMLWRPWRLGAGVFFGLACATKWNAVYPLAAFGVLVWMWDAGARRVIGVRMPRLRSFVVDALPAFGYLVLVALVVYLASWTGWLLHAGVYERSLSDTQYGPYWGSYLQHATRGFFPELWRSLRSLWHYHHDVYVFHTQFLDDAHHTYQSKP
ncbi:MAG TPA: phospholipid carrier-dependent glycosyltransferase, partial [Nocardioidaceae bacterium]|nr:phospholipid carrier-dependent glycosyltransferase [Nocardioidaceae bacterium]